MNNNYMKDYIGSLQHLVKALIKTAPTGMNGDKALRNYIKQFIVYALDVDSILAPSIDKAQMDVIAKKLRKSRFTTKKKRLRAVAVEEGLSAMVFSIVKNKVFFEVYKVRTPFTEIGDELTEVYVYKENDLITTDKKTNQKSQVFYRYKMTDGKVIKTQHYEKNDNGNISLERVNDLEAETSFMPVAILPNDENYRSTFAFIEGMLANSGKHLDNIDSEWEWDKAMMATNTLFNPELDSETLQRQVEGKSLNADGTKKRVVDSMDPNGLGGTAVHYISSGGVSSQVAQRNYDKFKEEALFYAISWLVVSDGKTNKHGAEIIVSQMPTFNHIQYQIELLEEFYSTFIFILHSLMIQTGELDGNMLEDIPEVNVKPSKYLEAILNMNNEDGKNNATKVNSKEVK